MLDRHVSGRKMISECLSGSAAGEGSGDGILAGMSESARNQGGHVALCGMQARITDIFSGIHCFPLPFEIFDSCDEALEVLQNV